MTTSRRATNRALKQAATTNHQLQSFLVRADHFKDVIDDLVEQLKALRQRVEMYDEELARERNQRVSAQRGLVAYMRKHGLAEQIGYDPDQDPEVQEAIKRGLLPDHAGHWQLTQILAEPRA